MGKYWAMGSTWILWVPFTIWVFSRFFWSVGEETAGKLLDIPPLSEMSESGKEKLRNLVLTLDFEWFQSPHLEDHPRTGKWFITMDHGLVSPPRPVVVSLPNGLSMTSNCGLRHQWRDEIIAPGRPRLTGLLVESIGREAVKWSVWIKGKHAT